MQDEEVGGTRYAEDVDGWECARKSEREIEREVMIRTKTSRGEKSSSRVADDCFVMF